jgi:hypothetical protein
MLSRGISPRLTRAPPIDLACSAPHGHGGKLPASDFIGPVPAPGAVVREGKRRLSEAARRALSEAQERRRAQVEQQTPAEINGRGGLDPARYGDWEIKGLASDF